jgi:hypothetical protein
MGKNQDWFGDELFDCFLRFWHVFWRFIEEWVVRTIENNPAD